VLQKLYSYKDYKSNLLRRVILNVLVEWDDRDTLIIIKINDKSDHIFKIKHKIGVIGFENN